MRTFSLGKALAVTLLLLAPWMAHAAGLGRLTVQSSLGQPLSAEIDLVAVRGDEASTLTARLAAPDAYQQANLQYNASLTGTKLAIERRANGQSYIRVTGSRPVNEPFIDLLIELSWSGGKIVREYTVLLDPPGYGQQAQAIAVTPSPAPAAPVSKPIAAPAAPAAAPAPVAAAAAPKAQEYGPVAKGETLGRIAASLKPQGVSLEQMLVGLYRSNPDAFIRNNMNLVKSGRILRVPDARELSAIPQADAVKEYKAQVADWRAYSGRLADAAVAAPEGGSTARGRITARVDDPAPSASKDVVKLSRGEPGKDGKALTGEAKARALQEELIARNKALAEAHERIAQLEKTIKDAQKLAELKSPGMAAAQQKAEAAKVDVAKPAQSEPAKPEPAKPDALAKKEEAAKTDEAAPKAEPKVEAPAVVTPAASAPTADQQGGEAKPAPKAKPKVVAPPPPPPEPEMMDIVMENLPLIGGGLGVLVLGGLGFAVLRRRRAKAQEENIELVPPTFAAAAGTAAVAAAGASETAAAAAPAPAADEVDPVQEAEVYIAYGRDGQAEEILKDAMARDPAREDVQVKLAEIYAARRDIAAFAGIAGSIHALTGGAGDHWLKVAALGYALDPANPLYEAGKDVVPVAAAAESAAATDLDFDLGGDAASMPDIALDADNTAGQVTELGGTMQMAAIADVGAAPAEAPAMTEFSLDLPSTGSQTDITLEAAPADEAASIDFNIELPPVETPAETAIAAPAADAGLDFKIDVGDLNINLDEPPTTAAPAAEKDSHWYDVQQKFDLAKAYQEMGDNEGAREILQEVLKEGDSEQKDQAQKLINSLG